MRKVLLLLSVMAGLVSIEAATITPTQALEHAKQFMKQAGDRGKRAPMQGASMQLAYTAVDAAGDAAYFVFNQGSDAGYVIVAGDDAVTPVIGYAEAGSFKNDEIPDNMQWWLGEMQREIEYVKQHPEQARKASLLSREVMPLLTCYWNQSEPYNDQCPRLNSSTRCVTGCVATAMAQIMYYHKWPQRGSGSHSYTSRTNGFQLSANFSQSTYDWANMLDVYGSNSSSASRTAVAKLMSDVGISVDMDYDSSSGAYSTDVANALTTYFGYDKRATYHSRDTYGVAAWEKLIRDELDASRPVYYSGLASAGGHAFVCDGYDKEGYFHFNWGWGGKSNGYFLLTMLNPQDQGIGSFEGGYNSSQAIITHIMPDQGGTGPVPTEAMNTCVLSVDATKVRLGSDINVSVNKIVMSGTKDWTTLYWGLWLTFEGIEDPNSVTGDWAINASSIIPGNSYRLASPIAVSIPSNLQKGKYYIRLSWLKDDDFNKSGYFTGTSVSDYAICLEVKDDGYAYVVDITPGNDLTATEFETSSNPVYAGNEFNVKCIVTNNGDADYYDYLYMALMSGTTVKQKSAGIAAGIAPGGSIKLNLDFTPSVSAGNYTLAVLNSQNKVIGSTAITVASTGGDYNLSIAQQMTAMADEMPANDVRATAKIKNSGGIFSGKVKAYILYTESGSYYIANTMYSDVVTIGRGETMQVDFKGEFAGEVGSEYYLCLQDPTTTSAKIWGNIAPFTVCAPKPALQLGDVDGNGEIDVADVTSLISHILGNTPEGFVIEAADVNQDTDVDVADATCLITMILSK
ncbi:MAG: C10 family peptidase [Bacteroidales bacterium]|nr:C10 family peptidase [Bacteroidales bacterium]